MRWEQIKTLTDSKFQRATGVKRKTFEQMLAALAAHKSQRTHNRDRPSSIFVEDQLLIMLMYYREYRTFLHISITYQISQAQCWRIVRKMEDLLIKSKLFHLLGKKKLLENNMNGEVVVVDVGESPKKTAKVLLGQKGTAYIKNTNSCR